MTEADVLAGWRRDFDVIYRDVQDIAVQRHIYREIRKELEASAERFAEMDGTVFAWLAQIYAQWAVIAIRKQLDTDGRAVSLRRLLEAIARQPRLITRTAYIGRAGELRAGASERETDTHEVMRQHLEERFDGLVGPGVAHLQAVAVRADRDRLTAAGARLVSFTNLTIAHRDRRGLDVETTATWEDLNAAIDVLEELVARCNELLGADHAPRLVPTWQYDWKAPLRIPWIT